jgi:sarcosine oxidase subunit beta
MESLEVGIVGAGVHGVSAAYHLTAAGVQVGLFDRGAPASGPTGRSSAICRAYYTNPFLARVAGESIELIARLPELTGRDGGFHRTGGLFLHPAADAEHVLDAVAQMNDAGVRVDVLDVETILRDHPGLDLDGVGVGAWEHCAGYADPVATTDGLFRRAVELGLRTALYSEVELRPRTGGGAVVAISDGSTTECERVLVAAGPWTNAVLGPFGVALALHAERHIVATFGWGEAPRVPFVVIDVAGEYYLKPEGTELFILGTLHEEPAVDPDAPIAGIREPEIEVLGRRAARRVPALEAAHSRGGWSALYDVSADWQPVIGEVADGVFVDCGTSGHGFKLAPALGRYVARMVTGARDPGLEQFSPRRFDSEGGLAAGFGEARILG